MTRHAPLLAIAALLTVCSGCKMPPRLVDYKNPRSDSDFAAIRSSPIVVVGRILSDTQVIARVPSHWVPDYPMQLRMLRVQVDNILRGAVERPQIAVYYFAFAGAFDGPRPLGMWEFQSRRIFYLRRDSGVLRTACDGFDHCTLAVQSGAHPNYKPDPTKPLDYAITDILFTKGEGVSNDQFAKGILESPGNPEDYLIEKLESLASSENPTLRTAACTRLKWHGRRCKPGSRP